MSNNQEHRAMTKDPTPDTQETKFTLKDLACIVQDSASLAELVDKLKAVKTHP